MNPMNSARTLLAFGAIAAMLDSVHFVLRAQSAPEPAPRVLIDAGTVDTGREVGRKFDVDWRSASCRRGGIALGADPNSSREALVFLTPRIVE